MTCGWQPAVAARPEVGDEVVGHLGRAGCEARWAGVVSVCASWQAKAQGRGSQWARPICGKMEKLIPNLIFGLTRILETKSRSFWGREALVKIPKILQNFIGILEMKRCELE
jgi:hypothetical protein